MDVFTSIVQVIIRHEGGDKYTNRTNDLGGPTKYGVTMDTLQRYYGRRKKVVVQTVRDLDEQTAHDVYRKLFWDYLGLDNIKSDRLKLVIFDQAVNRGPGTVAAQIQELYNLTESNKLKVDGRFGPKTWDALNNMANETLFLQRLFELCEQKYKRIVSNNPGQRVHLKGWLNRVNSLRRETMLS